MKIGAAAENLQYETIPPGATRELRIDKHAGQHALVLRTVIADDLEGHAYDFELADPSGLVVARRAGTTRGFGRRTFFARLPLAAMRNATSLTLTLRNHAPEPLNLESVTPTLLAKAPEKPSDFTLSFLVTTGTEGTRLLDKIDTLPAAPGARKAISTEFYFARRPTRVLKAELQWIREQCAKHGLGYLPVLCSWWAGTPREVWDRIEFQQVCWSETDIHDEGPALRQLLGDRWDIRYGLTTPNMWGNTPWQTMNHPELNELRHERMTKAVKLIEQDAREVLIGYVTENEPAYWAWEAADYKYTVKRRDLWADFNPHTVAAAAKDGVTLNPADGLGHKERMWLLDNLTRYMQACVDTITSAGASRTVYSHSLLAQHFPFQGTGLYHPYAETARVNGAAVGLETLWRTDLDALLRVREWGPWACVNREENDGTGLEYHVAMLQIEYALGATLFNSYNWPSVNENDRAMNYFREFLESVSGGGDVVAGEQRGTGVWRDIASAQSVPLSIRGEFPWFNAIELNLRAPKDAGPLAVWITRGVNGPIVGWSLVEAADAASSGPTRIDFGDLARVEQDSALALHFQAPAGWQIEHGEDTPAYRLLCNIVVERERSAAVNR